MRRKKVRTSIDKKIFTRTAVKTKRMNIAGKVMRGGTRL